MKRFDLTRLFQAQQAPALPASPPMDEIGLAGSALYGKGIVRYNPGLIASRKGPGTLRSMVNDDQIGPCLAFLQYAALASGFTWKLDPDHPEAESQEQFRDWAEAMMASCYEGLFLDLLLSIQSAHPFGFAFVELIYDNWEWNGRTTWAVKKSKLRPFETFSFEADPHGNTTKIIQTISGTAPIELEPSNPKFLHFVNHPEDDAQYGSSDLEGCYRDWWAKDLIIRFWNIYQQTMGSGFKVLEVKGNIDTATRAEIVGILQTLQAETGLYYRSDRFNLRIEWPTHTISFEKAIEAKNRALARSLLMPSLLGFSDDSQVGSLARSQTHRESLDFIINIRSLRIADFLNEKLWRPLAWWNFGLKEAPIYEPMPLSKDQKAAIAAAWADLVQKGAAKSDLDTENKIREWFDLPARAEDEESQPVPQQAGTSPLENPKPGGLPVGAPPAPAASAMHQHRHFAATSWSKRVNFKELDRWSESEIREAMKGVVAVANQSWDDMLAYIARKNLGTRDAPASAIEAFAIPKRRRSEFRAALRKALQSAWDASRKQAQAELPEPQMLARYAAVIPAPGFDETSAEKFFNAKTWQATQAFYERLEGRAREAMFNGIKYDKSTREVVESLKEEMGDMIPKIDAAGRSLNEAAYLTTMVRTLTWEAINESRMALFGDPELKGFVEALEYSAILDDRTTDICTELNGRVYPVNSGEWDEFRPPNHYNCRSLLVPVTIMDDWQASNPTAGSLQPQKGFY